MTTWTGKAMIYHIYTLGFCGVAEENKCKESNDDCNTLLDIEAKAPIYKVLKWVEHLKCMGINTILFGPLFESLSHGYDTTNYYQVDQRLGTNEDFKKVCKKLHKEGFRIVLDGVFNHVGRDFAPFKDLQKNGQSSKYKDWFVNVNYGSSSPYGDAFSYEAWEGHYNLVKLNLRNQEVRTYLLEAVKMWIEAFDIDGLRLDVAYCIDEGFLKELRQFVDCKKADFWLMGEMIHGDYSRLVRPELLHATTNYECYKGIYSSHNDKNYFEINHSLNRLFGKGGLCEHLKLYNFVDNHDVERIGSILKEKRNLKNVYTLLYTMPGIPSIYYGSEWGIEGKKVQGSDASLRPSLDIEELLKQDQSLVKHIGKLAEIRNQLVPLREGSYEQVVVRNQQLIYARAFEDETVYVVLNLADTAVELEFRSNQQNLVDVLDDSLESIDYQQNQYKVQIQPFNGKILASSKLKS